MAYSGFVRSGICSMAIHVLYNSSHVESPKNGFYNICDIISTSVNTFYRYVLKLRPIIAYERYDYFVLVRS